MLSRSLPMGYSGLGGWRLSRPNLFVFFSRLNHTDLFLFIPQPEGKTNKQKNTNTSLLLNTYSDVPQFKQHRLRSLVIHVTPNWEVWCETFTHQGAMSSALALFFGHTSPAGFLGFCSFSLQFRKARLEFLTKIILRYPIQPTRLFGCFDPTWFYARW